MQSSNSFVAGQNSYTHSTLPPHFGYPQRRPQSSLNPPNHQGAGLDSLSILLQGFEFLQRMWQSLKWIISWKGFQLTKQSDKVKQKVFLGCGASRRWKALPGRPSPGLAASSGCCLQFLLLLCPEPRCFEWWFLGLVSFWSDKLYLSAVSGCVQRRGRGRWERARWVGKPHGQTWVGKGTSLLGQHIWKRFLSL